MDRALSGATTLDQSGHGSNGNEGVLRIPQSSSTTAPADWAKKFEVSKPKIIQELQKIIYEFFSSLIIKYIFFYLLER